MYDFLVYTKYTKSLVTFWHSFQITQMIDYGLTYTEKQYDQFN